MSFRGKPGGVLLGEVALLVGNETIPGHAVHRHPEEREVQGTTSAGEAPMHRLQYWQKDGLHR